MDDGMLKVSSRCRRLSSGGRGGEFLRIYVEPNSTSPLVASSRQRTGTREMRHSAISLDVVVVVDEGANDEGADDEGADGEGSADEGADDEGADDEGADDEGADDEGADDEGADDEGADDDEGVDDEGADDEGVNDEGADGGAALYTR